jgi:hypothetical protein
MKPIAAYRHSPYVSSIKRSSTRPLVRVPFTFSEVAGPSFGPELISQASYDLTGQHKGEPLGERIIVSGRVLDENSRPPANTLVEVPQGFAPGMTAGTSVCTCATTSPGSRTTLIANVIRQKSFILIMRVLFRRVIPIRSCSHGSRGTWRTVHAECSTKAQTPRFDFAKPHGMPAFRPPVRANSPGH